MYKSGHLIIDGKDFGVCQFVPPFVTGDSPFPAIPVMTGYSFSVDRLCVAFTGLAEATKRGQVVFKKWLNEMHRLGLVVKPKPRYKHAGKYQIKMRKKHR